MNDTIGTYLTFDPNFAHTAYATNAANVTPQTVHDSLAHALTNTVVQLHEDPNAFFHNLLQVGVHFCLKVLAALIIYLIGAWLIKCFKRALQKVFIRRKTDPTIASFLSSVMTITCTILLIIITISTLGINTTSLAALLAAGGMAVGMAMSGMVQNFAGGMMILAFKPFKVGDYIQAQGYEGTVTSVSITSTRLRTFDNHEIVLPNGELSNGNINNHTPFELRRVDWNISVEYGTDAQQCIDLLKDIVNSDARVLTKNTHENAQDVFVGLASLNENDITFAVRAWVKTPDYWDVRYDLNQRFYTELPQHGINFAFPQVELKIKNEKLKMDIEQ